MPRLTENQCLCAVGMLETGMAENEVARHFGVQRNTISSLWRRFQLNGNTRDLPRTGRPRVTSRQQDNHIRLTHLMNRFQSSSLTARTIPGLRPISSRTVRNRLREHNIRPRRPVIRLILLQCHRHARLAWCRQHLRYRKQDWDGVLFTDESRFHLDGSDGRAEGWTDIEVNGMLMPVSVIQRRAFGGGSVMVWGGITSHGRTQLVIVDLTDLRYRDERDH
ncbi:Uncharacterised protein at_DN2415 [Pycnogonum litorale]